MKTHVSDPQLWHLVSAWSWSPNNDYENDKYTRVSTGLIFRLRYSRKVYNIKSSKIFLI